MTCKRSYRGRTRDSIWFLANHSDGHNSRRKKSMLNACAPKDTTTSNLVPLHVTKLLRLAQPLHVANTFGRRKWGGGVEVKENAFNIPLPSTFSHGKRNRTAGGWPTLAKACACAGGAPASSRHSSLV